MKPVSTGWLILVHTLNMCTWQDCSQQDSSMRQLYSVLKPSDKLMTRASDACYSTEAAFTNFSDICPKDAVSKSGIIFLRPLSPRKRPDTEHEMKESCPRQQTTCNEMLFTVTVGAAFTCYSRKYVTHRYMCFMISIKLTGSWCVLHDMSPCLEVAPTHLAEVGLLSRVAA